MNSKIYQVAFFVHKITEITLREIQQYLNQEKLLGTDYKYVIDELEKLVEHFASEKNDIMNPYFGPLVKAKHNKSIFG